MCFVTLTAGELLLAQPHTPREASHRHRERGLHQKAPQPVPHVRRLGEHGRLASSLRDIQEHLPSGKIIPSIRC